MMLNPHMMPAPPSAHSVVRVASSSQRQPDPQTEQWGMQIPRCYTLKSKAPRWNIPQSALLILERVFALERFPAQDLRQRLAQDLDVTPRQVQVWFQNRRQRERNIQRGGKDEGTLNTEDVSRPFVPLDGTASVESVLSDVPTEVEAPSPPCGSPDVASSDASFHEDEHDEARDDDKQAPRAEITCKETMECAAGADPVETSEAKEFDTDDEMASKRARIETGGVSLQAPARRHISATLETFPSKGAVPVPDVHCAEDESCVTPCLPDSRAPPKIEPPALSRPFENSCFGSAPPSGLAPTLRHAPSSPKRKLPPRTVAVQPSLARNPGLAPTCAPISTCTDRLDPLESTASPSADGAVQVSAQVLRGLLDYSLRMPGIKSTPDAVHNLVGQLIDVARAKDPTVDSNAFAIFDICGYSQSQAFQHSTNTVHGWQVQQQQLQYQEQRQHGSKMFQHMVHSMQLPTQMHRDANLYLPTQTHVDPSLASMQHLHMRQDTPHQQDNCRLAMQPPAPGTRRPMHSRPEEAYFSMCAAHAGHMGSHEAHAPVREDSLETGLCQDFHYGDVRKGICGAGTTSLNSLDNDDMCTAVKFFDEFIKETHHMPQPPHFASVCAPIDRS